MYKRATHIIKAINKPRIKGSRSKNELRLSAHISDPRSGSIDPGSRNAPPTPNPATMGLRQSLHANLVKKKPCHRHRHAWRAHPWRRRPSDPKINLIFIYCQIIVLPSSKFKQYNSKLETGIHDFLTHAYTHI
jgi:hypothetical protein